MPYKGDPIAEKLDKFAEATGVPRVSRWFADGHSIRFRYIPLALLALTVAGLWVQIAVSDMFGYVIVMVAWSMSFPLQSLSPLRQSQRGPLDEREQALVRSGHLAGLIAALGLAVLGSVFIALGSAATLIRLGTFWEPSGPTDWLTLALVLLAVESNVAVMAASARQPADLDDDE
jgi:hypothetical protein